MQTYSIKQIVKKQLLRNKKGKPYRTQNMVRQRLHEQNIQPVMVGKILQYQITEAQLSILNNTKTKLELAGIDPNENNAVLPPPPINTKEKKIRELENRTQSGGQTETTIAPPITEPDTVVFE